MRIKNNNQETSKQQTETSNQSALDKYRSTFPPETSIENSKSDLKSIVDYDDPECFDTDQYVYAYSQNLAYKGKILLFTVYRAPAWYQAKGEFDESGRFLRWHIHKFANFEDGALEQINEIRSRKHFKKYMKYIDYPHLADEIDLDRDVLHESANDLLAPLLRKEYFETVRRTPQKHVHANDWLRQVFANARYISTENVKLEADRDIPDIEWEIIEHEASELNLKSEKDNEGRVFWYRPKERPNAMNR